MNVYVCSGEMRVKSTFGLLHLQTTDFTLSQVEIIKHLWLFKYKQTLIPTYVDSCKRLQRS